MSEAWNELLPKRIHRKQDVGETMARVGLGLTVYLDEPGYWAFGGAERWARRFLELVPREELCFYDSSTRQGWRRIDLQEQELLLNELDASRAGRGMRHLLQVTLADDPGAPRRGFVYREVHPAQSPRVGYMQFFFGNDQPPDDLLALSIELATQAPIVSAVGGWLARHNPRHALGAYDGLLAFARRYLGMDIQRPDAHSFHARGGIPSVGWLTLLGEELTARFEAEVDADHPALTTMRFPSSLLLRAGPRPELGDCNIMEYPDAQLEAAQRLLPLYVGLEPFPGDFGESELTARWQHRFIHPHEWL